MKIFFKAQSLKAPGCISFLLMVVNGGGFHPYGRGPWYQSFLGAPDFYHSFFC